MAKALYGHIGGTDPQIVAEVLHLRRRVRDLEDEVTRLSVANYALAALVSPLPDDLAGLEHADLDRVELPAEVSVTDEALTRV
jgi:hypothetical protein